MKRFFRKTAALLSTAALMLGVVSLAACEDEVKTLGDAPYASLAEAVAATPDQSIAPITAEQAEELLKNPDRGLRMETYITLGSPLQSYPGDDENPFDRARRMIEKYRSDSPTVCQLYVYLSNYNGRDLDEAAFGQLKEMLEFFRAADVKILLRFAYMAEKHKGASYRVIKGHLEQIADFMSRNSDLARESIYCWQLGLVGLWGEGHSDDKFIWFLQGRALLNTVLKLLDEDMYLQVRTMDIYHYVPLRYRDRVGMHDDYIIDDLNDKWAFLPADDRRYQAMTEKFRLTLNDGEMPWGGTNLGDTEDGRSLDAMDGKTILQRIAQNSMTTFSLEHNYREKEGAEYSMYRWRTEMTTANEMASIGVSVNPALIAAMGGTMSIYDVLRYHLGYQLMLSDYRVDGKVLSFSVTNYGFAAPLKMNYFGLVVEENGVRKEVEIAAYCKEALTTGETVRYQIRLPDDAVPVGVRMSNNRNSTDTVRFANATRYEGGVQYFA